VPPPTCRFFFEFPSHFLFVVSLVLHPVQPRVRQSSKPSCWKSPSFFLNIHYSRRERETKLYAPKSSTEAHSYSRSHPPVCPLRGVCFTMSMFDNGVEQAVVPQSEEKSTDSTQRKPAKNSKQVKKLVDKSYPTEVEFNTPGRATQCVIFCPAATPKEAKELTAKALGTAVNFNLKHNPVAECFTAQPGKTIRQLLSKTTHKTHINTPDFCLIPRVKNTNLLNAEYAMRIVFKGVSANAAREMEEWYYDQHSNYPYFLGDEDEAKLFKTNLAGVSAKIGEFKDRSSDPPRQVNSNQRQDSFKWFVPPWFIPCWMYFHRLGVSFQTRD
jgi:hypothetical protein